jgi:putative copper export protein
MSTLQTLVHFLHVLAAIVWLGGVVALNILQLQVGRGPDRVALGPVLRRGDLYGRAVIAPAGVVTLLTGALLVIQDDEVSWSDLWVWWGIAGMVVSLGLGATLIRANNAGLRQLTAQLQPDDRQVSAGQRRAALLYGINLLVLLSVVWAMVFQPTL